MTPTQSDDLKIAIRGVVSAEDVTLARSLHRRGGLMWKAIAVLLAMLAAFVFVDTIKHSRGNEVIMALRFVTIALGALAVAFLYPRVWCPYETPGDELVRTVSRKGIDVQDGIERRFIPWEHVTRGRKSDGIGILYTTLGRTAYIFPRRMFLTEEDWSRFCEFLDKFTL